jgi:hypothetical protein
MACRGAIFGGTVMRAILGVYVQTATGERNAIAAVGRGRSVFQAGPLYHNNKARLPSYNVRRYGRG